MDNNITQVEGSLSIATGVIMIIASSITAYLSYGRNSLSFVQSVIWICLLKGTIIATSGVCVILLNPDLTLGSTGAMTNVICAMASIRDFLNFTIIWLMTYNYRMTANQLLDFIKQVKANEQASKDPMQEEENQS